MTLRRKIILGLAVLGAVYLVSVYHLIDLPELSGEGRLWDGYYTLVVPHRYDEGSILARLDGAGFAAVVSESRTAVRVAVFSHLERVTVPELANRLEPEDPRYDPYMLRVPGFFEAEGIQDRYRLYYLPAERGPVPTVLRLRRAFSDQVDGWFLADFAGTHRWVAPSGLFVISVVLVWLSKGRRLAMAALCMPWLAGSLSVGGTWVAYAGAACVGSFLILGSEMQPKSLTGVAGLGALLLPSILVLQMGAVPGPSAVAGLGSTLCVLIASRMWGRRRRAGKDHPLFSPLRMLPRSWAHEATPLRRVLPLLPGLLLLGGALAFLPVIQDIRVPAPLSASDTDTRRETGAHAGVSSPPGTLMDLWRTSRGDELPNLSDYLAHVAYQEGFAYGAEFTFPDAEAPLTLIEIREEAGRLIEGSRIAAVYDEDWVRETFGSVPEGSIERLLLQQPISTGVVRTPLSGLYSRSSHLITYSAVLLVAYSPIMIGVLILRLRGARARGSRSTLGRLNHGLAPYLPERGNSSI